jgi:hypothetical protein
MMDDSTYVMTLQIQIYFLWHTSNTVLTIKSV